MGPVRELIEKFRHSDGRIKVASALGILALAAAIAVFGVIPAFAGNGLPSNAGVQPIEIDYGGGDGGCAFIGSTYTEYHINNPMTGSYPLPGGGSVDLVVSGADTMFSYTFSNPNVAAFQITVNGGQKSLKYDNAASTGGPRNSDGALHAPTKGNSQTNLFKLSHINFCYGSGYSVSGVVYDDANVTGDYEAGTDNPEQGVRVTVLQSGTVKYSTLSLANGSYSFNLPNGTYTLCEQARTGRAQTEPTSGADCGTLGSYEAVGYSVTVSSAAISGKDFGTATELCGQTLTVSGSVFSGNIVIFASGNDEAECIDKVGSLFETNDGEGGFTLNFPLAGGGSIAAIADITKTFTGTAFVDLTYSQGASDTNGFQVVPWCGLRTKVSPPDGNQFNPYLDDDTMYPSLAGIVDPGTTDPSTACRVFVSENAEGTQRNILLIQGDPQFR